MKLLLDTHVWLWMLTAPKKLGAGAMSQLQRSEGQIWLSPVSVWETLILMEKGRIKVKGDAHKWTQKALKEYPLFEAPLTHAIAIESRRLMISHPDPTDRFLAATASTMGLTLLTADATLLRSNVCHVYPAGT